MGSNDHSFDVISEVNMQEADNAVSQAQKEISQRFDFKGSISSLELDKAAKTITLKAENEYKLKTVVDLLQTKCVKRGVSLKALNFGKIESGMVGGSVKQVVTIQSGLVSEKAKEITKHIKESKLKVQATIQGEQVRVQSTKIDELQSAIAVLKQKDFAVDLQFVNFR